MFSLDLLNILLEFALFLLPKKGSALDPCNCGPISHTPDAFWFMEILINQHKLHCLLSQNLTLAVKQDFVSSLSSAIFLWWPFCFCCYESWCQKNIYCELSLYKESVLQHLPVSSPKKANGLGRLFTLLSYETNCLLRWIYIVLP